MRSKFQLPVEVNNRRSLPLVDFVRVSTVPGWTRHGQNSRLRDRCQTLPRPRNPPSSTLHLHTQYSLLDGAIRIKDLMKKARGFGMPAVAMTDHGNLFGAIEFYQAAKKAEIKPIIGCEVYLAPGSMRDKKASSAKEAASHFTLLARDFTGLPEPRQIGHGRLPRRLLLQAACGQGIAGQTCRGTGCPERLPQGRDQRLSADRPDGQGARVNGHVPRHFRAGGFLRRTARSRHGGAAEVQSRPDHTGARVRPAAGRRERRALPRTGAP